MVYIKKLEMRGFKSFGHKKEVLPLSPGLTAIVGPNGSGKSNIIDALSFVLGQRSSKTLRASEFADLIYYGSDGSEGKRPASHAKVTIHLVDEEGSLPIDSEEITVSRKVNTDGKSTYRINGDRTTRKEITELLYGDLVGGEGYNFVMQGDVDKFIKMSSTERREIIDDLAGVAEFEEKKSKAMKELDEVETKLKSERGRLEELEKNMNKLKEEKEDVIRCKELEEELEEKRAVLAKLEVDIHREKLEDIQRDIDEKEREIKELKEEREEIEMDIDELEVQMEEKEELIREKRDSESLKELNRLNSRIKTLEERLDENRRAYERNKGKVEELREKAREAAEKSEEKSPLKKIEKFTKKFQKLVTKFESFSDELKSSDGGSDEFEESLSGLEDVLDEMKTVVRELEGRFQKALRSKDDFLHLAEKSDRIEEADSEFERLKSELTSARTRRDDTEERIEELEAEIEESREALERTEEEAEEVRREIGAAEDELEEIEGEVEELRIESSQLGRDIDRLKEEKGDLRVERGSIETEYERAKEDLEDYDELEIDTSDVDRGELNEEVGALEREIENLRPLNEKAVEEFEEAKERYESQKGHFDELEEERQTLLDFMEEIDRQKTEIFMETFEEVSRHFSEIFKELSPEGEARLILEDPESPLDAGLEMEAKPKGKKLKSVNSLSGGEKSLTGLAFIFAIQRANPSGLYVLDEIDAHLDPKNRKEVASLIKDFSDEAQITVVTLHESIMSAADKLFGINMDEENISHIVSVDLEQVKGGA